MTILNLSLILDIIGSALLLCVIFYSIKLNKYFGMLQKNKEELARQLASFAESTKRAEKAVAMVKASTKENTEVIEKQLKKAEQTRQTLNESIVQGHQVLTSKTTPATTPTKPSTSSASVAGARGTTPLTNISKLTRETSTSGTRESGRIERENRRTPHADKNAHNDNLASGGGTTTKSRSELLKALQGVR